MSKSALVVDLPEALLNTVWDTAKAIAEVDKGEGARLWCFDCTLSEYLALVVFPCGISIL